GARAGLGLSAEWGLLFVGRPAPVKGLEVLLQALARLRADGLARADVRLVIVGGDVNDEGNEDRARLRALAGTLGVGGWIDFKGPEPQSALPEYYRAADLCLVPSHHESFGMAALEAMACGATVAASPRRSRTASPVSSCRRATRWRSRRPSDPCSPTARVGACSASTPHAGRRAMRGPPWHGRSSSSMKSWCPICAGRSRQPSA